MASGRDIGSRRVRVPEHVVQREFPEESVVLNLDSGTYHGLNRTAATMLTTLAASPSVADAVELLSTEFGQPREQIEDDVMALCEALAERGLIVYEGDPD